MNANGAKHYLVAIINATDDVPHFACEDEKYGWAPLLLIEGSEQLADQVFDAVELHFSSDKRMSFGLYVPDQFSAESRIALEAILASQLAACDSADNAELPDENFWYLHPEILQFTRFASRVLAVASAGSETAPEGWLRVSEAASDYELRADELSRLCNSGDVESLGKGRARRINPNSLRTFLRKRTGLK